MSENFNSNGSKRDVAQIWDLVIIDDDPLIRRSWVRSGIDRKKRVLALASVRNFYEIANSLLKDTPIYIDSDLKSDVRGEIEAKNIYDLGFCSVYLVTGYAPENFPGFYWLKGVQNKFPPWRNDLLA